MPTLTIQLPGLPVVSHVLKDDTITIGRMKGNTIVVEDDSVSLSHARITRRNGEFYLKDLNSTNGTVVNGQSIMEVKLTDLDRVRFADVNGQFFAEAAAAQPSNAGPLASSTVAPAAAAVPASMPAQAAAKPGPSPSTRRGRSHRKSGFSFARLANRVVPVIGGGAALAVFAAIGWRMLHMQNDETPQTVAAAPAPAPFIAEPARTDATNKAAPNAAPPNPVAAAAPAVQPAGAPAQTNQDSTQWIALLKSPDAAERRRAATALHSLGTDAKDAVPALREALQDSDPDVRMWAAVTLVNDRCYDKATIPILLGVLRNDNPVLRQVACLSLGIIPYEQAEKDTVVPLLKDYAAKDPDEDVRKAAVSALNILAPQ